MREENEGIKLLKSVLEADNQTCVLHWNFFCLFGLVDELLNT